MSHVLESGEIAHKRIHYYYYLQRGISPYVSAIDPKTHIKHRKFSVTSVAVSFYVSPPPHPFPHTHTPSSTSRTWAV